MVLAHAVSSCNSLWRETQHKQENHWCVNMATNIIYYSTPSLATHLSLSQGRHRTTLLNLIHESSYSKESRARENFLQLSHNCRVTACHFVSSTFVHRRAKASDDRLAFFTQKSSVQFMKNLAYLVGGCCCLQLYVNDIIKGGNSKVC